MASRDKTGKKGIFVIFRFFHSGGFLSALLLLISGLSLASLTGRTEAQALLNARPMSRDAALKAGYKFRHFSFSAPHLDFSTYIPKNADVKTLPYKPDPIPAGQIGRVLPIGQISFSKDNIDYEDIIFSYHLRSPPAAYHTCMWYMTNDGYHIVHAYAPEGLISAQLLGVKLNDQGAPDTAGLAYCYARGDNLIGQYFMVKLPPDEGEAEQAVVSLRDIAADFIANMQFDDKRPIGLDNSQIATKTLQMDSGDLTLSYPKDMEISSKPDKVTTLPYELFFTQKLQDGRPFSHIMFAVNAISGPNREEAFRNLAEAYVAAYLDMQQKSGEMPQGTTSEFMEDNTLEGYGAANIGARSFRYKLTAKEAPKEPTLFQITMVRSGDKLYVIYYHSLRVDSTSAGGYFTGSMGDVTYDMLRDSLKKFLLDKQKE